MPKDMIDVVMDELEENNIENEEEIPDEEIESLDDFDLEMLIVNGTDEPVQREIKFYNHKAKKTMKMPVYLRPVSHGIWSKATKDAIKKNSNKNIEELICSQGWVDKDGLVIPLTKIRGMQKGVVTAVYEEIKIISGQTEDRFEEKYLQKISDF